MQGNYVCTWDNTHHYLWFDLYEYLLHPSIPLQAPNLDIVLKNLSRRLPPSVQLDGFDISFEAVPTQEWLPPNMKLIHWDNKTDVPKETEGRYDVMHLRHFIFVLLAEEIKYTLEKLLKLLKPGGYLQWSEVDMTSFRVEKTRSGVSTQALTAMVNNPKAQTRASIHTDVRDAPSYLMTAMHECNLVMHGIFIRKTKDEAGAGKVEKNSCRKYMTNIEYRRLVQGGESASSGAD
ncbi:hypothetical protein BDV35DRAFT_404480 [Aspergillus flavus]|uniref:UMTA methyltransferase family protein n=1 Tax=Aspergillus flavus TaxID=5059 RepID=A0A5N6H155_ASPFL|nr:hypothetical protein BDV35DRAFT_404480 [Aspergillus flavus]